MTDKDHIDEKGLEELLRKYSLEEEIAEELSVAVLSNGYQVQPDKKKEKAMLDKLSRDLKGPGKNKPFIFGAVVALLIAVVAALFFISKGSKETAFAGSKDRGAAAKLSNAYSTATEKTNRHSADQVPLPKPDTFGKISRLHVLAYSDSVQKEPLPATAKTNVTVQQTALPFLSEKDRVRYAKIKQQMLDRLYKADKGLYTHITANKTEYAGKPTIIDAFAIRNIAVTNLEYKTFLADLIVQYRSEDYFRSEVLPLKWKQDGYEKLAYAYFQEDAFNDFPVVNVGTEGARLFCKWLDEELKTYITANKLKQRMVQVRLPYDKEWILAARDGYAKISYETGYNTIYEIKEGLVDLSFVKRMHQIRKKAMDKDTLYPLYITNRYGWPEQKLTDFLGKAYDAYSYMPADTICPDRMKVYGKIGHVSEMVPQFGSPRIWLTGLTWKTKEEYQSFESAFKAEGVSPFVTFRYVIIDAKDAEYKDPFW